MPLSRLTDGHLEDLVAARKKAGHKPNTINVALRVIKAMVNASKKRFASNPDLTFPMQKGFEKTRFLSWEEEAMILDALSKHEGSPTHDKARDLYLVLVDTGLRLSEALNLEWGDVNLSKGTIEAYRLKNTSLSLVPISDRVREVLVRRQGQRAPLVSVDRAITKLMAVMRQVCNGDAKLNAQRGKATLHSLRDTYASRMAGKGMSLHTVSKLLGHSTPTMTRKYAHIEPQDVAEEARRLLNA